MKIEDLKIGQVYFYDHIGVQGMYMVESIIPVYDRVMVELRVLDEIYYDIVGGYNCTGETFKIGQTDFEFFKNHFSHEFTIDINNLDNTNSKQNHLCYCPKYDVIYFGCKCGGQ